MKPDNGSTNVRVSLSRTEKKFVDKRVAAGSHGSASDYIRALIRRDGRDLERGALGKKLVEAMDSPASPMTKKDWQELRDRALKRDRKRKSG